MNYYSQKGSLARFLRDFHGIGPTRAVEISEDFGYLPTARRASMSKEAVARISAYARSEGMVRELRLQRIKRKVKVGTVAGIRMRRGLPTRGQRTQTNASTAGRLNAALANRS